jgi:hypothetical protein
MRTPLLCRSVACILDVGGAVGNRLDGGPILNRLFVVVFGLALIPAGTAAATASTEAVLKCGHGPVLTLVPTPTVYIDGDRTRPAPRIVGGFPRPRYVVAPPEPRLPPVFVLDGKIIEEKVFSEMDKKTIESIQVVCSDESHRPYGVEPGRDLVVIVTKTAARAAGPVDSAADFRTRRFMPGRRLR